MKDYIIKEVDGHHVVRLISDEEMEFIRNAAETIQRIYDVVKEFIESVIENLRTWIKENNIIELLEECENVKHSTEQIRHSLPANTAGETGFINARHSRY